MQYSLQFDRALEREPAHARKCEAVAVSGYEGFPLSETPGRSVRGPDLPGLVDDTADDTAAGSAAA